MPADLGSQCTAHQPNIIFHTELRKKFFARPCKCHPSFQIVCQSQSYPWNSSPLSEIWWRCDCPANIDPIRDLWSHERALWPRGRGVIQSRPPHRKWRNGGKWANLANFAIFLQLVPFCHSDWPHFRKCFSDKMYRAATGGCHQAKKQLPWQLQFDAKMAPKIDSSDLFWN